MSIADTGGKPPGGSSYGHLRVAVVVFGVIIHGNGVIIHGNADLLRR